ncbi:hypothetical protein ATANTOWER_001507 [Ataeniobius toweri]|uniref:Uncharacterized protein n=1 Tax=Ataeniobius toweri TaxID=208326 RepID=A0ABU7BQ56_9TELE|nr:hypothetical protein [Ataeniobius toweri]
MTRCPPSHWSLIPSRCELPVAAKQVWGSLGGSLVLGGWLGGFGTLSLSLYFSGLGAAITVLYCRPVSVLGISLVSRCLGLLCPLGAKATCSLLLLGTEFCYCCSHRCNIFAVPGDKLAHPATSPKHTRQHSRTHK